jgi:hypothetical protein
MKYSSTRSVNNPFGNGRTHLNRVSDLVVADGLLWLGTSSWNHFISEFSTTGTDKLRTNDCLYCCSGSATRFVNWWKRKGVQRAVAYLLRLSTRIVVWKKRQEEGQRREPRDVALCGGTRWWKDKKLFLLKEAVLLYWIERNGNEYLDSYCTGKWDVF